MKTLKHTKIKKLWLVSTNLYNFTIAASSTKQCKELIEELTAAGIDDFVHIKTNVLESLKKYQIIIGIN